MKRSRNVLSVMLILLLAWCIFLGIQLYSTEDNWINLGIRFTCSLSAFVTLALFWGSLIAKRTILLNLSLSVLVLALTFYQLAYPFSANNLWNWTLAGITLQIGIVLTLIQPESKFGKVIILTTALFIGALLLLKTHVQLPYIIATVLCAITLLIIAVQSIKRRIN